MEEFKIITLGADPEVFLRDFNGKMISAVGKIGGTKEKPIPIPGMGNIYRDEFTMQEDNVALEYNIPPAYNIDDFVDYNEMALLALDDMLPADLEICIVPSAKFDPDQLNTRQAKRFGCDPDYNAWTGAINPSPKKKTNLRSCGGHIHLGLDQSMNPLDIEEIVRYMDLFLGVPSILLDFDKNRRQLYGKAGSFRFQSYGLEYRTLSNFWLNDEAVIEWVAKQAFLIEQVANNPRNLDLTDPSSNLAKAIVKCINNSDTQAATELVQFAGIKLPYGTHPLLEEDDIDVAKEELKIKDHSSCVD